MKNRLKGCNSGDFQTDPDAFQKIWCVRCSQTDCSLAGYARTDLMSHRNAHWVEKYFKTRQIDPSSSPQFAHIANLNFKNLAERAIELHLSEERGDWSVPTTVKTQPPQESTEVIVERAVENAPPAKPPLIPNEHKPPVPHRIPNTPNTVDQGPIYVGEQTQENKEPPTNPDPWSTEETKPFRVVRSGASLKFSADGQLIED